MAALALGGCATRLPPVEVTRFHLGQPIPPGTVFVEPAPGGDGLEQQSYARAVESELARLGYPGSTLESAGYVVTIAVARDTRDTREALARRSPVSIGVGGGTGGYGSGVGLGVGLSLGGNRGATIITQLEIKMKRRVDAAVVWEGRAELAARAKAPASQPGLAASKLAQALFSDFPGESGRTIAVE